MDYGKIDAALAAALQETTNPDACTLEVFVHTKEPPGGAETALLEELGIKLPDRPRTVFSGVLSAKAVDRLSSQPWVRSLKLAQKLHLR